jgi:hypothetical protein
MVNHPLSLSSPPKHLPRKRQFRLRHLHSYLCTREICLRVGPPRPCLRFEQGAIVSVWKRVHHHHASNLHAPALSVVSLFVIPLSAGSLASTPPTLPSHRPHPLATLTRTHRGRPRLRFNLPLSVRSSVSPVMVQIVALPSRPPTSSFLLVLPVLRLRRKPLILFPSATSLRSLRHLPLPTLHHPSSGFWTGRSQACDTLHHRKMHSRVGRPPASHLIRL